MLLFLICNAFNRITTSCKTTRAHKVTSNHIFVNLCASSLQWTMFRLRAQTMHSSRCSQKRHSTCLVVAASDLQHLLDSKVIFFNIKVWDSMLNRMTQCPPISFFYMWRIIFGRKCKQLGKSSQHCLLCMKRSMFWARPPRLCCCSATTSSLGLGLTHNLGNDFCKFNVNLAQYKLPYTAFCLQKTAGLKRLGLCQLEKYTATPTNVHTRKAINLGAH